MTQILITVGTTSFDLLVEQVESSIGKYTDVIYQVSHQSKYIGKESNIFPYLDCFEDYVNKADVIVTHAGAGSVYDFLEKKKRIIVVPNLERYDKHQKELANYIDKNNFGLVGCAYSSNFENLIDRVLVSDFNPYSKVDFFFADGLYKMLD
ncbi:PssE/Cps14G family polysaccharide biosynthesis glycosyltransferase [Shewanella litorisediminis]|uniref:Glycosyl transferase family 28 C-terminal domain-containing protein n=1 Tax=Shewanella litorisediminis TaxID=1173586 RepID=A0ABX7FZK8_9GAMM|nr:PssE/Cps14G family polysaccharide biosynthesis glycosyltransferase [Shewanella litorisediminis]MCL2919634.1 hypothetical protein [Shewanella litorisediminis]QRH00525.1 hypothetical protein JQC75_11580 [Shewanella litorisediminis]